MKPGWHCCDGALGSATARSAKHHVGSIGVDSTPLNVEPDRVGNRAFHFLPPQDARAGILPAALAQSHLPTSGDQSELRVQRVDEPLDLVLAADTVVRRAVRVGMSDGDGVHPSAPDGHGCGGSRESGEYIDARVRDVGDRPTVDAKYLATWRDLKRILGLERLIDAVHQD